MAESVPDATGFSDREHELGAGAAADVTDTGMRPTETASLSPNAVMDALQREAAWYQGHPRARMNARGMCAVSPREADDTADLMLRAVCVISTLRSH